MPDWFVSNPNLSICHLCLINCIGCQSVKELCTDFVVCVQIRGRALSPVHSRLPNCWKTCWGCYENTLLWQHHFYCSCLEENLCVGDRAFSVIAPRLWNILPVSIKNATSQQSFKSMLKDYLFPWLFSICFLHFISFYDFHVVALCNRWKSTI